MFYKASLKGKRIENNLKGNDIQGMLKNEHD